MQLLWSYSSIPQFLEQCFGFYATEVAGHQRSLGQSHGLPPILPDLLVEELQRTVVACQQLGRFFTHMRDTERVQSEEVVFALIGR